MEWVISTGLKVEASAFSDGNRSGDPALRRCAVGQRSRYGSAKIQTKRPDTMKRDRKKARILRMQEGT